MVFGIAFQVLLKPITILAMVVVIDWAADRLSGSDREDSSFEDSSFD